MSLKRVRAPRISGTRHLASIVCLWGACWAAAPDVAIAGDPADGPNPANVRTASAARFVVRFRPGQRGLRDGAIGDALLEELRVSLGRPFVVMPTASERNFVVELTEPVGALEAARTLGVLRMRPDVTYAEFEPRSFARATSSKAAARGPSAKAAVRRLIVVFADPKRAELSRNRAAPDTDWDRVLSASAGTPVHVLRATVGGAWVVEFFGAMDADAAAIAAARLETDGSVRFAAPDIALAPTVVPNDPSYLSGQQWNLASPFVATSKLIGIDAGDAWDITTGSPNVVIAVVDSGIVPHPDLDFASRILPGFNFISDPLSAGNGVGRNSDATDQGDWRTAGICPAPMDTAADSSWHGTIVAGIIAARANNGIGIAGIDWRAHVLPVRVLGKCGASGVDLLEGIAWAAGVPIEGVPDNPTPAQIINLSLGGQGACTPALQHFFDVLLDLGVFIAVAAGNEDGDVADHFPASCLGLTTVAATNPYGARAQYSNFGPRVDISAPGGEFGRRGAAALIVSTSNSGTTAAASPIYTFSAIGTSLAAPHVAGVASLVAAANVTLGATQIKQLMIETATPFPAGSDCHPGICGAGVVNAYGAVHRAANPAAPGSGDITPVAGVWWNPSESGSGYGLDFKDGVLLVQIYSYRADGSAQWYLAEGSVIGNTFSATLDKYVGGQCISCTYRGPSRAGNDGQVTITFTTPTTASVTLPGGRQFQIQRYFQPPVGASTGITPVGGVWWNPAESGSGYALDFQGGILLVQIYSYLAGGPAQWYLAEGTVTGNALVATLDKYTGGQCIACAYRGPTIAGNDGPMTITFTSPTTATVDLPGGRHFQIQRYFP